MDQQIAEVRCISLLKGLMLFKAPIKIQHEDLPKLKAFMIIQPLSRYKEKISLPLSEYMQLLRSEGKTFIENLVKIPETAH